MKIGVDVHGLLDDPKISPFFAKLSLLLVCSGHEVHIITGAENGPTLQKELTEANMTWTHLFSVTDYHKAIGTPIDRDEHGRPWMSVDLWNAAKGQYCREHNIDMHFDDSAEYHEWFTTPYCRVVPTGGKND